MKPGDSPSWKDILCCMELIKPYFRWKIGDGMSISFWYDNWMGNGRLCEKVEFIRPLREYFAVGRCVG